MLIQPAGGPDEPIRYPLSRTQNRSVHIPVELLRRMKPEAKKRGVPPETLAYLIIDAAVAGNLINAVLDDGAE